MTKQLYTPIAAVVAMRLKEDEEPQIENVIEEDINEQAVKYRGAYLIISNRYLPDEALEVYMTRWRIVVFYRATLQEFGLSDCHSTTEIHHHAHLELHFSTETPLNFAQWLKIKKKRVMKKASPRRNGQQPFSHSLRGPTENQERNSAGPRPV